MKLVIEMNNADLACAKPAHMNQIIAAMQAVAVDSREAEAPVEAAPVVNEKAETPATSSQPVAKAAPVEDATKTKGEAKKAAQKPKEEKPVKAAAKKASVKEEPKAEEPEPVKEEAPKTEEEPKIEEPADEPPKKEAPAVDRDTVLSTFKALAKAGKSAACKKILQGHGLKKLSEIPEDMLGTILEEAKAIG